MFNKGILDSIGNYQGLLEKIYVKHRAMDDLDLKHNSNVQLAIQFTDDIKILCEA
jgi:hypothetical protein